ncbi:MAG: methyltransferase domain-containing protein [Acidimicrobiia bacterium]|nr:methyltransferase domain-containing protein [Acidimicrobiia bacterium]
MTFDWAPQQYALFADHRKRAAIDLLSRVHHESPRLIHDIGCGRGEMARVMADRWPEATVIGSDLSSDMLDAARAEASSIGWRQIDISTWQPDATYDVLYANAVFHWVPDHAELLPRLVEALNPGGVLAFQMPLTWPEPINRIARELVEDEPDILELLPKEPAPVEWYYDTLARVVSSMDIWETRYQQVLSGDDPVVEWAKGAALRPVMAGLKGAALQEFLAEYSSRLSDAYPRRSDGSTLLPFPRRFVVATV